jgi:hypothetical protein
MTAEVRAEPIITLVRPTREDSALTGTIASAKNPVVSETASAARAGVAPNALERLGNKAWALYIDAKVVSPAANNAAVILRSCEVAVPGTAVVVMAAPPRVQDCQLSLLMEMNNN